MSKKAFCVGINDYPCDVHDLNGCVNDAKAWAELLITHFNFPRSDVKIITDSKATKSSIIKGIKNLLEGASSGDILVFTNASHGSYIADTSGDEDKYDEVICPYDVSDNLVVDDELRELFSGLKKNIKLTVISDSCFSGTVTRGFFNTPDDRRYRFLDPSFRGDPVLTRSELSQVKQRKHQKYPESSMNEILLSGCSDSEYAHDAKIDNVYHGLMSYFALQTIQKANYKITYNQLAKNVNNLLAKAGYPQHPQLEGNSDNKKRQIFT